MATYIKILNFSKFWAFHPGRMDFGPNITVNVTRMAVQFFGQTTSTFNRVVRLPAGAAGEVTPADKIARGMFKTNDQNVSIMEFNCSVVTDVMPDPGGSSYPRELTDTFRATFKLHEVLTLELFPYKAPDLQFQMMLLNE